MKLPSMIFSAHPWVIDLAANAQEYDRLMMDAQRITGKDAATIRDAAARSPFSFRDFVQQIKLDALRHLDI
jgi:hypothetical protein